MALSLGVGAVEPKDGVGNLLEKFDPELEGVGFEFVGRRETSKDEGVRWEFRGGFWV